MQLAAQLYTIREFTKTPKNIRESLKKVAAIGYKYVQVSGFGSIEPKLLREYLDESRLACCVTHMPFDRIVGDTVNLIEEHKLWGCDFIGLGCMPNEFRGARDGYDRFLKAILPAASKIKKAGLKLLYHNHRFELERVNGVSGIDYIAANTSPDELGFLADFYWLQAGGAMPVQFIKKHAERLQVVHFKDMAVIDDKIATAEIGEGNMDYRIIYDACKVAGVKYVAVEQDDCRRNPFVSLAMSYSYLKSGGMF